MNQTAHDEHRRAAPVRESMIASGVPAYPASPSGCYILALDGREVMRGTEGDLWSFLHRHTCASVSYALRHGGYSIRPA